MTLRRKPKRLPGDNPLLRARFREELSQMPFFEALEPTDPDGLTSSYRAWLEHHGINPDTGKMTPPGLAFFEALVAQQNARNRALRDRRRRAA